MNLKTTLGVCALASAALIPTSQPVHAYEVVECNGKVRHGVHATHTLRIDRCYTPAATSEDTVLGYARDRWHKVSGVHDRFSLVAGDNNCAITSGDTVSEIAMVAANHPLLAGSSGRTISRSNPCLSPFGAGRDGRITEVDVLVSEVLQLGLLGPLDVRTGGRQIAMHELGHVLGADSDPHEVDEPALMNPTVNAKLGHRTVIGVNANISESYFPDDIQLASRYHSDGGAGLVDPAVSGWQWSTVGGVTALNRIYIGVGASRDVCRGTVQPIRFSQSNLGKADILQGNQITMRIMLSDNDQITTTDRQIDQFMFWGTQGFYGTSTRNILVPANLPLGVYHVGILADPGEVRAEQEEGNNSTPLGLVLNVNC